MFDFFEEANLIVKNDACKLNSYAYIWTKIFDYVIWDAFTIRGQRQMHKSVNLKKS